ncbi:UV-stimulated scaffold protein A isoform 3-T24 [Syngnathus typhle]
MSQLTQNHADIRLAALMIASDLFPKSHHFRTLLVENFQEFLELTVQTNLKRPLPPPQLVARKLRSLAVQTIQSWQSSYGSAYKKLELGYHFLKQFKKVDFQEAEAGTVPEQERQIERQRKMQRIYDEKLNAAIRELEDCSPDIEMTLRELDSCLKLLFPQFTLQDTLTTNSCHLTQTNTGCLSDDESPCCSKNLINDRTEKIQESKERVTKEENDRDNKDEREEKEIKKKKQKRWESEELKMRNKQKKGEIEVEQRHSIKHEAKGRCEAEERDLLHVDCFIQNSGLLSRSYRLDLNLSPGFHVEETEDNEVVVSTLFDLRRLLITKHLPAVRHWVQVFTKSGANQHLLRRALDLKISLESSLLKLSELNIDSKSGVNKMASSDEEEDDDDCSDFIVVPENGCKSHQNNLQMENDWHDAGLVRDIEVETGQNPGSDGMDKWGKRRKNKYPNLSNLKDRANTSRARLEKRIFNKSAMRRVAQMMTKVDSKKHESHVRCCQSSFRDWELVIPGQDGIWRYTEVQLAMGMLPWTLLSLLFNYSDRFFRMCQKGRGKTRNKKKTKGGIVRF